MVARGYHVKNEGGQLPFEDATLDMSNPEAVKWYQDKLRDLLVKDHSVIPHIKVAQSTKDMDWDNVELRVFSTDKTAVQGLFTKPDTDLQTVALIPHGRDFVLKQDLQAGKVKMDHQGAESCTVTLCPLC